MALQVWLRVGDTSAQDISLTSSGVMITDYPMSAPDVDQATLANLGDGNSLSVPSWGNVTESIDIHISLATATLVAAKVQAIERLLDLARQGTQGLLDDKAYLRVQYDQDTEPWRSQILAAKWESDTATNQIWRNYVHGTIIITRRYFWETEALQPVAITSGTTTTATTSYAEFFNADDTHATHRNWLQMAAAQVAGSIPAPAKISIKNTTGASRSLGAVYLGNYVFAAPTTLDPILRGSDAAGSDTTPGTTEGEIYYWSLSSGNLVSSFNGQFGRYVVVWSDRPAITTLLRAAYQFRFPIPSLDLALGEQMLSSTSDFVTDLGSLPIPPGGYVSGAGASNYLAIKGKAASGTDTLGIDWLQIFPSGTGLYRVLKGITSLSVGTNDEIVDDGPIDKVYALSGGVPISIMRPLFTPIFLWPNRINRLRVIISSGSFSFEPDEAWGVKVEMRYRRLTF